MKPLAECLTEAMQACQQANFQATSDNICSLACTLYIQGSKGGGSRPQGNYSRKKDVPKEMQRGASPTQVKQVGAPCEHCGQPLKASSKGNAYCKCWYEEDPNKLPPQAPAPGFMNEPQPQNNLFNN